MKDEKNALIEATYKLVLRTSSYADFLGAWENSAELSEREHGSRGESDHPISADFTRLLDQAITVLEEVKKIDPSDKAFSTLSNSAAAPTAIVGANGIILSAMDGFVEKMGLRAGDQIESWNFEPAESKRLRRGLREIGDAHPSQLLAMVRTHIPGDDRPGLLSLVAASYETAFLSVSIPKFTDALRTVAADLFDLTEAEVAVLASLIEGVEVQTIATMRSRSIETVRSQLKSILRKVGAHSQAELVGIFSTIPKFLSVAKDAPGQLTETHHILPRQNGRLVSYSTAGPIDGQAVVLFHGMIDGAKLPKQTQALFAEAGLRTITPARPGFGRSGTIDHPTDALTTVAEDCRAILDALNIRTCVLVGQLGGAVYAAATAALMGDRIRAVVNLAGTIPFTSEEQFRAMTRGQRVLAKTYVNAPGLAVIILRAGIALVRKGQDRMLLDAQFPKESPDHAVLHQPDTLQAIREGYHFAFDGGHHAHYIDARSILSNWSELADRVEQPMICLHGGKDPVTPIRFVREYVQASANRSLVELPERGQLLLYSEQRLIVETLRSLFADLN